jgi:hypothetical protein
MNNSFTAVAENPFDRRFGGTSSGVADPYVSGYHFIYFKKLPDQLAKNVGWVDSGTTPSTQSKFKDIGDIQNTLSATCQSVTPPGGTLNKAEFTGLGGSKWSVPTNFDYGNTLTVKFLEFSSTPIMKIFHGWIKMIRDYRTGVSNLVGNDYTKSQYTGTMLYWTTKPDGKTVEYSACYTGCFPTKDPQDLYSGDIGAYDKVEVDMEFSIDWAWHESWVKAEAQTLSDGFYTKGTEQHGIGAVEGEQGKKEVQ